MIDELLEVTDLVMLDLKQMNDEIHQNLVEFPTTARWSSLNIWRTKM